MTRKTSGPHILPAPGTVARPVATGILQIQVPVDRFAVAPETGTTEPTVRDQGLQKRIGRASVGVALARPVSAPARGPIGRIDLTDMEGRRDASFPSFQAVVEVRTKPGDIEPVLGTAAPVTVAPRTAMAIAVPLASSCGQAAAGLVDHAGSERASKDPPAPAVRTPQIMEHVARPLALSAPPWRRRRAPSPIDGT